MKRNQNRRRWEAPHNNNNNNNGNSNIRARPQVLLIVSSIIVIVYISQVVFYVFCASRLPFFQEQHDDQHIIMMTITTSNTASSRPSSSRPAAAIMKTSTRRTRSHDHQHHVVAGVGADTTTIISNKTKDATTNAAPLPLPNNTMEKGMEANNTTKNCVCDGYDLIHDLLNKLDHGDDVESDPVGGDREEDYQEQVSETTATSRKTSTITSISNKPLYDEEGNNKAAGSFPFHSSEGKEKKENNYHTRVTTGGKSYSFLAEDQMAPRVCVIVTTYNVVGYVAQAMESILNQTYKNLEVIVVDDHSNDGTVELVLEKYVKNSSRMDPTMMTSTRNSTDNINVQVISLQQNTNGGTGQPSNIGMESCSSSTDYIMFADGDDYMELDAVEALVGMAKKCKAQVVIGHHDEVTQNADGSTSINPTRAFSDWRKIPSRTPFNISTHPLSLLTSPAPWRKLYLRAFLIDHHIQFQE
jgi:Glycosyltransferases involved in cell wall biogenesis